MDRTYPPRTYHDTAGTRTPQIMRATPLATAEIMAAADPLRPCPVRGAEKLLFADEGPYATAWLALRGDTVRLAAR